MANIPSLIMWGAKSVEFLRAIAPELNMENETDRESILNAYLKNTNNINILLKQLETKGSVNRVLVIGQTGAGKSSLINLLAGKKVANVSDSAKGCTFDFNTYQVEHQGEIYELIDTVGLNEGANGTVTAKQAMKMLIKFIKGNKRGFSCVLFVMPKGRLTDSFEKNHMLFSKTLLNNQTPSILFVGHCEADEPMNSWILNNENKDALQSYHFSDIVCGTAQDGGRFGQLLQPLREETKENLWESICQHMLDTPRSLEPNMHLFKRVWNSFCDLLGLNWKFLTDQFSLFIQYLKSLGVDDETLQQINAELH